MTIARLAAVMDQHPPARAPGIARALAVLMLLVGIVAMHSAVFGTAHASDSAHGPAPVLTVAQPDHQPSAAPIDEHATILATEHAAALPEASPTLPVAAPSDPHTGCGAEGCDEHAAVHACVFVLAALAIALTLVLLYRLGDTSEATRHPSKAWRGRRTRPPPWTVLTLSQLAILRI
ncbi:DUF6153 family protein [Nocardia sp. PE-7]|uniref:DUF6153 family protein n=1 Tax=Nocardia sp. PE-7 TaxID=3058426 RepID=UPI002658E987|nr:DUF6153 family protein [Nocardia sp. PE-7]WKG08640.1 DUF6153 family protein [Nocardia sp. PE-7]